MHQSNKGQKSQTPTKRIPKDEVGWEQRQTPNPATGSRVPEIHPTNNPLQGVYHGSTERKKNKKQKQKCRVHNSKYKSHHSGRHINRTFS